jgi:bifunctional DNase/RNase
MTTDESGSEREDPIEAVLSADEEPPSAGAPFTEGPDTAGLDTAGLDTERPDIEPPDTASALESQSEIEPVGDFDGEFDEPVANEPDVYLPVAFVDVVLHLPSSYPTLILEELDQPRRRIMIPIGMAEGVAIAHAARGIATPKPLTHALLSSVMSAYGVSVEVMRIYGVKNNSFNAELVLSGPSGQQTLICRVSDGVALCLRQRPPVPITVSPGVIDQVGITTS